MFSPESRKPVESSRCGSPSPRSTRSSATWTATASAFSPLLPRRATRAPTSCCCPSSPSPAIRPRTCSCDPPSCARRRRRPARSRRRHDGIVALVGTPWSFDDGLANACAVCVDGELRALYRKRLLPNYGVFDEERYFEPGTTALVLPIRDLRIGFSVCEDVWQPAPPPSSPQLEPRSSSTSPRHRSMSGRLRAARRCSRREPATTASHWSSATSSAARTNLSSMVTQPYVTAGGEVVARAPGFEEYCSSSSSAGAAS